MSEKKKIAVIGCGIFGATIALRLAASGFYVKVFERSGTPLKGATYNNHNRLHLGFHYPRDMNTARQSIRGFNRFVEEFSECILKGFPKGYFIASEGSFTTPDEYLTFCEQLGVEYKPIEPASFPISVENCDLGVLCKEYIYDCTVLRKIILEQMSKTDIELKKNTTITDIKQQNDKTLMVFDDSGEKMVFDAVINSTYADINRLTAKLGFDVPKNQYEYTIIPIIETDYDTLGLTVMDGPFTTLLPFGKTGYDLLYHVKHSVLDTAVEKQMPKQWLCEDTTPFAKLDTKRVFEEMRKASSYYVPSLEKAKLVGFLKGPRMVLARHDDTDARPSMINAHHPNYLTVFSGKIDHCLWLADDVEQHMKQLFC